jgi:hypothetical protein
VNPFDSPARRLTLILIGPITGMLAGITYLVLLNLGVIA